MQIFLLVDGARVDVAILQSWPCLVKSLLLLLMLGILQPHYWIFFVFHSFWGTVWTDEPHQLLTSDAPNMLRTI